MENTLFAENFDHDFDVPGRTLSIMADIHTYSDLVELQEFSVYAINLDRLRVGTAPLRSIYGKLK